jgi:hypothetical protein
MALYIYYKYSYLKNLQVNKMYMKYSAVNIEVSIRFVAKGQTNKCLLNINFSHR